MYRARLKVHHGEFEAANSLTDGFWEGTVNFRWHASLDEFYRGSVSLLVIFDRIRVASGVYCARLNLNIRVFQAANSLTAGE